MVTKSIESTPSFVRFLMDIQAIAEEDLAAAEDGFFAIRKSLADILS